MTKNIHPFSEHEYGKKNNSSKGKVGIRGREALEFASLELPILPGFIIDAEVAAYLQSENLIPNLRKQLKKVEEITGKTFNDPKNPMLVKIVISPNLAITNYPTLHNYGLTDATIGGFSNYVGKNFGLHEVLFLIKGNLEVEAKIAELENRGEDAEKLRKKIEELVEDMKAKQSVETRKQTVEKYRSLLPDGFFADAYTQLEMALKRISTMLKLDELDDDDAALLVVPMVYGNYGPDSAWGMFFTRNIVTGEKKLEGEFHLNKFDSAGSAGKDINKIQPAYLKKLEKIARIVEDRFREIRSIRFTIENKKLWLLDQRPVMTKSSQADIKTLLDLNMRKIVADEFVINAIKPSQLNEILHPVLNLASVKNMKRIAGGISGAPGAAIGRVYFSTDTLLDAYRNAKMKSEDTRLILCMPATLAEDVKAIEVATGVLSSEGGYAAHASVVARQYGKVSLVIPELKIRAKTVTLGEITIKEGDYITLNVPQYGDPQIYFGKAELIEPNPEESGLLEFLKITNKFIDGFNVRVNADGARQAALAIKFGASGIGLCRTEHMFFEEKKINTFREMIIADSLEMRVKALNKLKIMQKTDFYKLFKVMEGKPVTIRLLDAPLHEFLPHDKEETKAFMEHIKKNRKSGAVNESEILYRFESLKEFNPMLGHRGCRIAVTYPEIYTMQMQAIFEAVYALKKEGIAVFPEIMIPLIMNENELKLIIYGKKIEGRQYKGLVEVESELREKLNVKPVPYKIGTMIELPGAALGAGEIAKYAEFFSFGTNDLTQTTSGLSRDDFNSFMPDYTLFDIIKGNPFQLLDNSVKELIYTAVRRGTMTRPKLKKGLCGEHGAIPENIKFCMDAGLDYVSCSVYSVPIARLAVAQFNLAGQKGD